MKLKNKKNTFLGTFGLLFGMSAVSAMVVGFSTSCSNLDNKNSNDFIINDDENGPSEEFLNITREICKDIKITPKSEYSHLYANSINWPLENLTTKYLNGIPKSRDTSLIALSNVKYRPQDGQIDIELTLQSPTTIGDSVIYKTSIKGFAKEPAISIMNRLYGKDNINITPTWGKYSEDLLATEENWSIEKITDEFFNGLPQDMYGIKAKVVDVICDSSELGQLKLKYNFYYNGEEISTRTYTVNGFAIEDPYSKVERVYGDVNITANEGAKKFSAIGTIWTPSKITSSWFNGLPVSKEGIDVKVKEVITDPDLESLGKIQIVYNYSKDSFSVDKTYDVDGFYKDPDVAFSNLYLASVELQNLKLNKDIDASKFKLKDIAKKDSQVIEQVFDMPKIPYISYDYEIISWRNWKEGDEKIPAGAFKVRFNIKDDVNGNSKTVESKLFYGFEDVLGLWNERFVYNKVYNPLVARNDFISWREFYTGTGKGGSWDYSYNNILPATGVSNSVWLPLIMPDIPGNSDYRRELDELIELFENLKKGQRLLGDSRKFFKACQWEFDNPQLYHSLQKLVSKYGDDLLDVPIDKLQKWKDQFLTSADDLRKFDEYLDIAITDRNNAKLSLEALNSWLVGEGYDLDKWFAKYTHEIPFTDGTTITVLDGKNAFNDLKDKIENYAKNISFDIFSILTLLQSIVEVALPIEIYVVPLMQSKAYLPIFGDFENQYRYTKATAESDAEYTFGFVKPDKSRLDNFLTYDVINSSPITWDNYKGVAQKGAIEALRRYVLLNNYDGGVFRKELKFDDIKYSSYKGVSEVKKLPNGYDYGMGHKDGYWFMCNYTFEVSYDGETIEVPFTMRLGTIDGIDVDEWSVGDENELDYNYKVWK